MERWREDVQKWWSLSSSSSSSHHSDPYGKDPFNTLNWSYACTCVVRDYWAAKRQRKRRLCMGFSLIHGFVSSRDSAIEIGSGNRPAIYENVPCYWFQLFTETWLQVSTRDISFYQEKKLDDAAGTGRTSWYFGRRGFIFSFGRKINGGVGKVWVLAGTFPEDISSFVNLPFLILAAQSLHMEFFDNYYAKPPVFLFEETSPPLFLIFPSKRIAYDLSSAAVLLFHFLCLLFF